MRTVLRRLAILLAVASPTLGAVAWSVHPAVMTLWAAYTVPEVEVTDDSDDLATKRRIQRHFLDNRTYVPLEDIVAAPPGDTSETALLMQKACGRGKLFIWLPIKFKLPVLGEKVYEWCWKPQTKDT